MAKKEPATMELRMRIKTAILKALNITAAYESVNPRLLVEDSLRRHPKIRERLTETEKEEAR